MLTIRLQRVGRKNDPSFRVILVEAKRAARAGAAKEILGSVDRRTDRVELNAERIKYWISMGATLSDSMHNLLISQKIIEGKKINVLPRKSPPSSAKATEDTAKESVAPAVTSEVSAKEVEDNDVAAETPAQ